VTVPAHTGETFGPGLLPNCTRRCSASCWRCDMFDWGVVDEHGLVDGQLSRVSRPGHHVEASPLPRRAAREVIGPVLGIPGPRASGREARVDIMGFSRKPPDPTAARNKGPHVLRAPAPRSLIRRGRELDPSADRCPGAGWHFHLDSIESPGVERIYVTVPRGQANRTWGLMLDDHLPWPGPPPGITEATVARVGDPSLVVRSREACIKRKLGYHLQDDEMELALAS
jgi:hypothetical protein